jgi:transcriptional regulator with XRE-family HTH domain
MSDTVVVDEGRAQEPEPDSVEAFAEALRDLKRSAGNPTLAALSARTGISKSVISVAFSGRALPTENTVMKLVTELGGAQAEWRARRNALDPRSSPAGADAADAPAQRRRFSLLQTAAIAISAALVSALATSLVWGSLSSAGARPGAPENAEGPYLAAANGVDPMRTACKEDAVIAASEARLENQVHVQLLYSNDCMAVWGRVTRYDNKTEGNTMTMRIWPMDDPTSERAQSRTDINLQSLYTPMIIEPDVAARICGQATITVDGRTEDLGPKLCV